MTFSRFSVTIFKVNLFLVVTRCHPKFLWIRHKTTEFDDLSQGQVVTNGSVMPADCEIYTVLLDQAMIDQF